VTPAGPVGNRGLAGRRWVNRSLKRVMDVAVSLAALVLLSPLLLLIWAAVRLTSPGPALFRQQRLGLGRRPFVILKFRSMRVDCDDTVHRRYMTSLLTGEASIARSDAGLFKLSGDARITVVGGWLRRTSLDEIPQLVNVLRGDMSLVGPRPVLAWESALFDEPDHCRFQVKPGMTGLWQVSGRNRLTMREALVLDAEYVRRHSLTLDLVILLRTIPALLRGATR
jgi:lipopolysaccharide/colanic/teichoic acid biosynthesis glycosyltransferase